MSYAIRRLLFLMFFTSGFSSLVYQIVWTRMAFASFGIITPVLSVVLSVFMLGLAAGAWLGGRYIGFWTRRTGWSALLFYACAEVLIGLGAFSVPKLFAAGERLLLTAGETDSFSYLSFSALVLALSVLPWCVCMGTTFPLMMAYVREQDRRNTDSFSYLYVANVLGAMAGTFLTAIAFVELLGFRHTLLVAATGNFAIAFASGFLAWKRSGQAAISLPETERPPLVESQPQPVDSEGRLANWVLFSTGFGAMAMEVVWTRAFTPVLRTQVYSFASIIFSYLGATVLGSLLYRYGLRRNALLSTATLMFLLVISAFLPVIANDLRLLKLSTHGTINMPSALLLLASICPLCAVLGYLTPLLIDRHAAGRPAAAGRAYAINVLGCILGPLAASYILLPFFSERNALIILCLPFLLLYFVCARGVPGWRRWVRMAATAGVLMWSLFFSKDIERYGKKHLINMEVRRDHAASVISTGEGMQRQLLVNGVGMTVLTPITKLMVHMPLVLHNEPPESALIVCFGMGTTYRSALSWNLNTIAVELVPSVKEAFGFYHADAAEVLENPSGRIIIDDGRRYLRRTREKFDVIVIDPPPPIEAAGSSLLYSTEFYELAKARLSPGGILQAWFPGGERTSGQAVMRSVCDSFPYVRAFIGADGWGIHFLASMEPIEVPPAEQLIARVPLTASHDLLEWNESQDLQAYLERTFSREIAIEEAINPLPDIRITDDQPYNEYFLLRRSSFVGE
jgi:spermidine synthase